MYHSFVISHRIYCSLQSAVCIFQFLRNIIDSLQHSLVNFFWSIYTSNSLVLLCNALYHHSWLGLSNNFGIVSFHKYLLNCQVQQEILPIWTSNFQLSSVFWFFTLKQTVSKERKFTCTNFLKLIKGNSIKKHERIHFCDLNYNPTFQGQKVGNNNLKVKSIIIYYRLHSA